MMQDKTSIDDVISFVSYSGIDEIISQWNEICAELSVFYSPEFLRAVENAPPDGLENRYLLVYENEELCGVVSCQLKSFNARKSISFKEKPGIVNQLSTNIKNGFSSLINFEGLVCGSILLTGMYAYHFKGNRGHKSDFLLAEKVVENYRVKLNSEGRNIKVTFLKDFYADKKLSDHNITETGYKEFSVQPNMILKLRSEWKTYEDYIGAFQSKYRVRAKRARKKMNGVTMKELDFVDIRKYNADIFRLYRNIVDNINFNLFFLHEEYFAELKKNMKNKFRLYGYFKNEKLVAFYTCIDNKKEMNAHFLGYDPEANREHQLYLNSLYDMVDLSLQFDFDTINFSRTAMEIKSSMGAEPFDMLCYLKHKNNLINKGVDKIVGALNPTEDWIQRKPFKV